MKKMNQHIKTSIFILFSLMMLGSINIAKAQTCNQVEILYQQPDCYKSKTPDAGGTGPVQGRDCTPVTVCVKQLYTYSAGPGWASYLWAITAGPATPAINPSATSANINISWPVTGTYILTLTVTDGAGNIFTKCLEITVKDKPTANFSFAPNNACAGSVVNFTNSTVFSGTPSYSWNFGDLPSGANNYSVLVDPTHIFSAAGTYTVTLIAYSTMLVPAGGNGQHGDSLSLVTCCADTIKKIVTVLNGKVSIECVSTVCAGDTAKYTAVGCATPVWFPPVGGTIINQTGNQVTVVWGNGNPQGQLSVQCGGGCVAYVTVPIVPSAPVIVGNTAPCNTSLSSYSLPYLPGTGYAWTLTDVTNAVNANNLLSTYPDNNTVWINWANATVGATYQLSITLTNKHLCCTSSGSINITPKQKFVVIGSSSICAGQAGSFATNPAGIFNWAVLPVTGVVTTPVLGVGTYGPIFNTPGSFIVTATNTSGTFCNTSASFSVTVVPVPVAGVIQGPLTVCTGTQYTYNMSTPAPAGYYYEWTISNGAFQPLNIIPTVSGNTVNVTWTTLPGTLSVQLKQSAAPFCIITVPGITATAATVGAVSGPQSVCVDGNGVYTITLGSLPAGEPIVWTITPSASLGTITPGPGANTITVLWHGQGGAGPWGPATINASTGCGNATPLGGIMIYPKFTLSIASTGINVCQPGGVTLTANGAPPGASFNWTPGGSGQTINVTSPGTYTVVATKGGCSATKTINVPDPFAIMPVTCGVGICNGLNTNEQLGVQVIKPGSGSFVYQWYSGVYPSGTSVQGPTTNGSLSNNYLATAPGSYYVVVKYGTCTKYVTFNVAKVCCPDVNHPAITNVTQVSCNTYSFTANYNPSAAPKTWDFGDGNTTPGTLSPISHTYAHAGVYCVKFCVGAPTPNPTNCAGNCVATNVTVPIEAGFSYTLGCNGCLNVTNLSIVIPSNTSVVTYLWDFGDASTSNLQNPAQHCYASGGTYIVKLTITYTDGAINCTSTAQQTVVYTPLAISNSSPVCTGTPVLFNSTPGGFVSYSWTFGDGYTAYTSPISHGYTTAGNNIPVSLSVTDLLGNTCTANSLVNVLPGINSCTIAPAFLCPGSAAVLTTPLVAGYSYLWEQEVSPGIFAAAPGTNTGNTYTTTTVGNYHVVITNANNCFCISNKVPVTAVAKPKASFSISPSKNLCNPGGMIALNALQVSGSTYDWYMNGVYGTPIGSGSMYSAFVNTTTTYNLIVTNQYGCKDTCTQTVTVNPTPAQPIIITNPTGTLCEGVPITLSVTNYPNNITWNNGANSTSITVTAAGTYVATYTNPVTGCSSSAKVTVNRRPSAGLFPHFCDSIPCNCIRPFVIYAPDPLLGTFAGTYNINWYNANTNAFLGSGPSYNNGGLGVQTGSYYIIITDPATGCKDTSNHYSIVVPHCDTCDCKGSHWGEMTLTPGEKNVPVANVVIGNPISVNCGGKYVLNCNQPYTFNGSFICKDSTCKGKITYSLKPPVGLPITGTVPGSFTPTQSGVYVLTLYGWCGNKICDSCNIYLTVKCDPICDCKGSHWGERTITDSTKTATLNCNKEYTWKCNKPFTINASYNCVKPECNGSVSYILNLPSGSPLTGTVPLTYTPTVSGVYTVVLYGMCGNTICDSCVVTFKVDCPRDTNCCKHDIKSEIGAVTYSVNPAGTATVASVQFGFTGLAGVSLTEVRAEVVSYDLSSNFNNECLGCKTFPFTWASVNSAGNIGAVPPKISLYGGNTTPVFNPTGNAMYQNPREVVWNNGSSFTLGGNIGMNFFFPPPPVIDCCELKGRVCVKFTFRDDHCNECTVLVCFDVVIKKK